MLKRLVNVSLVLFLTSVSFAGKNKPEPDPVMSSVTARAVRIARDPGKLTMSCLIDTNCHALRGSFSTAA
jgi:hypothetical protein